MTISNSACDNQMLRAAAEYARRGWGVLPLHSFAAGRCTCDRPNCPSPAKHPLLANGCSGASSDLDAIRTWWSEAPTANVGIATGEASGLWVLDLDGADGIGALAEWERRHGPLPPTATARTGGGGRHVFFAWPSDRPVRSSARVGGLPIDARGAGGYVVAAPSAHASGARYEWEVPPDAAPLAEAPPWLLDLLAAGRRRPGAPTVLRVRADDVRDHPGAAEGNRHAEAARMVGAMLARGMAATAVEAAALDWADRCAPPFPAEEVRRIVADLAARRRAGPSAAPHTEEDRFDELPLPPPPPWPTLNPDALHGLAGDVVRTIAPESEADPVALLATTLVGFGSVLGRGAYCSVEGDRHAANLFACLVGASSRGRKGVSRGRALQLLAPVDPDWAARNVVSGLSSGEGLVWAVRDPIEKSEPVKQRGQVTGYQRVVTDEGVADKRLLVIESEFAQPLRVLRREGNVLSATLREGWDSGDLRTMVKHSPARATGAHISVIGHITRQELVAGMSSVELANGFANRFLWLCVRRARLLPDGGRPVDLRPLSEPLAEAVRRAREAGEVRRTAAGAELWRAIYPELTAERCGRYGAVTARAEAQVLRLSLIYSLLDGAGAIDVPHLRAALAVWRYADESARLIFGGEEVDDPLAARLLAAIRAAPQGLSRRELFRHCSGHIKAEVLAAALAQLRDRGLAECRQVPTGGRPAERWFARDRGRERSEQSERRAEDPRATGSDPAGPPCPAAPVAAAGSEVLRL